MLSQPIAFGIAINKECATIPANVFECTVRCRLDQGNVTSVLFIIATKSCKLEPWFALEVESDSGSGNSRSVDYGLCTRLEGSVEGALESHPKTELPIGGEGGR